MERKKKKQFREIVNKAIIYTIISLVIITFIVGLVYTPWNRGPRIESTKIAEINKNTFVYQPGSSYYYLANTIRSSITGKNKENIDQYTINKYAAQLLVNYDIMNDYANKIGISPSKETLRSIIEYILRGRLNALPDKGLMEYGSMEYANLTFSGENGDLANSITPVTIAELYQYYDLLNFMAQTELLYINITNYIIGKISEKDIEGFYLQNISNYSTEAYVEEVSISNKALAYEMNKFSQEGGWNKMIDNYKGKYIYTNQLTLKNLPGLSKRFFLALTAKTGDITQKPQFENGMYHILKIIGFPNINNLNISNKNILENDYVSKEYTNLRTKFDADIKDSVHKAEEMIKSKSDFRTIANATGMSYVKTGKISPVSVTLKDEKDNIIPLPLIQNDAWTEFIFSANKNDVSKTFNNDDYIVIIKEISKGVSTNIVYQNIDQDVALAYMNFKISASRKDWFDNLKKQYQIKVFDEDIKKFSNPNRNQD